MHVIRLLLLLQVRLDTICFYGRKRALERIQFINLVILMFVTIVLLCNSVDFYLFLELLIEFEHF